MGQDNVFCVRTRPLSSSVTVLATISVHYCPDTTFPIYLTITTLNILVTFAMRHALPSISTQSLAFKETPICRSNVLNASMGARGALKTVPTTALSALQLDSFSKAHVFPSVQIPIFTREIRFWILTGTSKNITRTTLAPKRIS